LSDSIAEIIVTALSSTRMKEKNYIFATEEEVYVCMHVCVCAELFANFHGKNHRLAHQLRGAAALKATYLTEDEAA